MPISCRSLLGAEQVSSLAAIKSLLCDPISPKYEYWLHPVFYLIAIIVTMNRGSCRIFAFLQRVGRGSTRSRLSLLSLPFY